MLLVIVLFIHLCAVCHKMCAHLQLFSGRLQYYCCFIDDLIRLLIGILLHMWILSMFCSFYLFHMPILQLHIGMRI